MWPFNRKQQEQPITMTTDRALALDTCFAKAEEWLETGRSLFSMGQYANSHNAYLSAQEWYDLAEGNGMNVGIRKTIDTEFADWYAKHQRNLKEHRKNLRKISGVSLEQYLKDNNHLDGVKSPVLVEYQRKTLDYYVARASWYMREEERYTEVNANVRANHCMEMAGKYNDFAEILEHCSVEDWMIYQSTYTQADQDEMDSFDRQTGYYTNRNKYMRLYEPEMSGKTIKPVQQQEPVKQQQGKKKTQNQQNKRGWTFRSA